jgi:carbon-monoxide dehydrogenase large subunit
MLSITDTNRVCFNPSGTGGAKTLMLAGTALVDGADKIIAKGRKFAAHFLEAAEDDIEFKDGTFTIAGTDRAMDILSLAQRARAGKIAGLPDSLDEVSLSTTNKNTFPNGCHVCEVEIDRDTGVTQVMRYSLVDDFGRVINPLLLAGQIHGGIVQGVGQALLEQAVFDPDSGQLLTGSFMDYAMPRATDVPSYQVDTRETPCSHNPLGVKGCGEAGAIGAPAALMNAITDALGVKDMPMPATPQAVWTALKNKK